jgi:hypothetical protein
MENSGHTHLTAPPSSCAIGDIFTPDARGVFFRPDGGRSDSAVGEVKPDGSDGTLDDVDSGFNCGVEALPLPLPLIALVAVTPSDGPPAVKPLEPRGLGSLCECAFRRIAEFHRFLTAFSERPGRNLAMSHQRFPVQEARIRRKHRVTAQQCASC